MTRPPARRSPRSTAPPASKAGCATRSRWPSISMARTDDRRRGPCATVDFAPMPTFKSPRGTRALLPDETPVWTRLERLAADLAQRYGYRRIETPMLEQTGVFERGV